MNQRGFFGVGIFHTKTQHNVGTLYRSAMAFGAAWVFTIGRRYQPQASDTTKTLRHIPLIHYRDIDDLIEHLPWSCPLVGVELHPDAITLSNFQHPQRACYLLGAEDHGIPPRIIERCHTLIQIPAAHCLNVATAGSIVMYDRVERRVK